ncbi:MAG: acyl-CoA dehydrogenase family protein [Pseudomonadota bacterium]
MALLSEEQSILKDQAKAWASEQAPVSAFREMRDSGVATGYAAPTWESMVEMGWTGILVPEAYGGADLGYLTFGVVLEELGRQLTASPLFASAYVSATALRLSTNTDAQATLFPRLVDGSVVATLAVDEGPHHNPSNLTTTATSDGGSITISGAKTFVPEALGATHFIVAATFSGDVGLFVVPADKAGVSRSALALMDSRGYGDVTFDGVQIDAAAHLTPSGSGADHLTAVLDFARTGLTAEMLGTGAQAFDMTLEYLQTRKQFGKVIGSFQALGHRAAELFSAMELARSCSEAALQAIDADADNVAEMASLAKAQVGEFLYTMSNQLIQIHGGIGMTDEFDAGLYLKRARVLDPLYGNRGFHRDRYARLLGF